MKKTKILLGLLLICTMIFSSLSVFADVVSVHLPDYIQTSTNVAREKTVTSQTHPTFNNTTANLGLDKLVDGALKGNNRMVLYGNKSGETNSIDESYIAQATIDLGEKYDIEKVVIMNGYSKSTATVTAASYMYGKLNIYGSNDPACALAESSTCTHAGDDLATCYKGKWKTAERTLIGNMDVDFTAGEKSYTFSLINDFVSGTTGCLGKNVSPDETGFRYIILATDGTGMSGKESTAVNLNVGDVEVYGTKYVPSGTTESFVKGYKPYVSANEVLTHGFKSISGVDLENNTYKLYTAFFNNAGQLKDIAVADLTSAKDLSTAANEVEIADDANEYAKVKYFLWNGTDGLTPVADDVVTKGTKLVSEGKTVASLQYKSGAYSNGTNSYSIIGINDGKLSGTTGGIFNLGTNTEYGYTKGFNDAYIDLGEAKKIGVIRIWPRSGANSSTKGMTIYGFNAEGKAWWDAIGARETDPVILESDIETAVTNGYIEEIYTIDYNLKGKNDAPIGNLTNIKNDNGECEEYINNIVISLDGTDEYRYIMVVNNAAAISIGELQVYAVGD